jgi:hypothetical protein
MFEVRFANGVTAKVNGCKVQDESFDRAKAKAQTLHNCSAMDHHFEVWEVKQVWTTQTLNEAILKKIKNSG